MYLLALWATDTLLQIKYPVDNRKSRIIKKQIRWYSGKWEIMELFRHMKKMSHLVMVDAAGIT